MCYVYAIGDRDSITNKDYSNCYIGVANDLKIRWIGHTKSKYTVGVEIRRKDWSFELNMAIVYEGVEDDCFIEENRYRPMPFMGLNEAVGGCGGYTNYSPERNRKISTALKGRIRSKQHSVAISDAKKGKFCKDENPNASRWKLIDPDGNQYIVTGHLQEWCAEKNISWTALRANLGKIVGDLSPKFRDKGNTDVRVKRVNTIGWTLFKEK